MMGGETWRTRAYVCMRQRTVQRAFRKEGLCSADEGAIAIPAVIPCRHRTPRRHRCRGFVISLIIFSIQKKKLESFFCAHSINTDEIQEPFLAFASATLFLP